MPKFTIFKCKNGFLMNVQYSRDKHESRVYKERERMTMLADINEILGPEPDDAVGLEPEAEPSDADA